MGRRGGISLLLLIWIIVGVVFAVRYDYLTVPLLRQVAAAILAILLWPLVLLGIDLHLE
jgi:lipopolysaccharide export LptBFGC system permease protein LptF